jgi:Domain of unknown function (DUF4365)
MVMKQPKKIATTAVIGERGVNLLARIVWGMGFVWYPTGSVEAGIDGHVEMRDAVTGQVFNSVLGAQSKATDGEFPNETDLGFDFYCDERDLEYWLRGNLPVILVVSRPARNEAYWISVKDYFRDPARRAARKAHFDKRTDRFDTSCKDVLFRLAAPRDSGLYLAAPRKCETLISNLLPVVMPARIFIAATDAKRPGDIWRAVSARSEWIGGEWILRNKNLVSFRDLRRPEWADACDQGSVDEFAVDEWALTDDPDRRRDFVDLLQRSLREMVRRDLAYHEGLEVFYFRATPDLTPREVDYQGLSQATDRTVFKAYLADDGSVKYYRHSAFRERFHRFDGAWYLELTPTYYFTSDGYRLRARHGRFLKAIKEIEGHAAVRGQLLMWASFLTPQATMFETEPYAFLGLGKPATFEVDRGIDDARWDAQRKNVPSENKKRRRKVKKKGPVRAEAGNATMRMFEP